MSSFKVRPVQAATKVKVNGSKVVATTGKTKVVVVTEFKQGPAGPVGPAGGITMLEQASDFNSDDKTDGSVIEFNQTTGNYEAAEPISNRQINGGYF
ncbi:MAG: hypothetical protein V7727_22025 [Sneathiella sp.]